jgi:hypothetical protein
MMIRTQISLTEEQMRRLRDAAERRGVPMAQVVRDAVDAHLDADPEDRDRRWEQALAAVGTHRSNVAPGARVGRDHDEHLPDAYERPGG